MKKDETSNLGLLPAQKSGMKKVEQDTRNLCLLNEIEGRKIRRVTYAYSAQEGRIKKADRAQKLVPAQESVVRKDERDE